MAKEKRIEEDMFCFCIYTIFLAVLLKWFGHRLRGEVWSLVLFYAGIAVVVFYYHLKPDDNRLMWDRLPMIIAFTSLLSSFMIKGMGARIGLTCLFLLLLIGFISICYERTFNDLRLSKILQMVPCIAIPVMASVYPPKYTHSTYWLWVAE
ncbi:uncharacterized protein LOC122655033 [Telopea speciosissima]|uniref:uncharacterized protein LOC122655033 n=1 Tax=Telopea speciosissima TaxID=54955 RepID=UPI001CC78A6B|nr:uncharacterized protein LOC122655033 [Telopea speciosissima]